VWTPQRSKYLIQAENKSFSCVVRGVGLSSA
jgi:hypothetical protein